MSKYKFSDVQAIKRDGALSTMFLQREPTHDSGMSGFIKLTKRPKGEYYMLLRDEAGDVVAFELAADELELIVGAIRLLSEQ